MTDWEVGVAGFLDAGGMQVINLLGLIALLVIIWWVCRLMGRLDGWVEVCLDRICNLGVNLGYLDRRTRVSFHWSGRVRKPGEDWRHVSGVFRVDDLRAKSAVGKGRPPGNG